MEYKNDWKDIRRVVRKLKLKYDFNGLLHFTDFNNLKYILGSGYLYSRDYCKEQNIQFIDGASSEVLDRASSYVHQSVRFYYRGNTPTLYHNEGVKLEQYCDSIHIPMPVYLLFDEKLIYLDSTSFTNGNATISNVGNSYKFFNNMDWDTIFHNTWFYPEERDYIIKMRQAELLSNVPVDINKYLKKIVFRCKADLKRAINVYGINDKYEIDLELFSNKNRQDYTEDKFENNFIKDYKISYLSRQRYDYKALIITIFYQKKINSHETSMKLYNTSTRKYMINKNGKDTLILEFTPKEIQDKKKIIRVGTENNVDIKIEIYINKTLYIEEYLYNIEEYDINVKDNKIEFRLNLELGSNKLALNNQRYNILDENKQLIDSGKVILNKIDDGYKYSFNIDNVKENWRYIQYIINDVLYIEDTIKM